MVAGCKSSTAIDATFKKRTGAELAQAFTDFAADL
jgi:hypothetical protein